MTYKCALCGQISFKAFTDYEDHRALFHGLKTQAEPLKPTPSSNYTRTRQQVIDDVERRLSICKPATPETLPKEETRAHGLDCNCQCCFITKLQSLIDSVILDLDIITKAVTLRQ